jgi:hypothetical protein
MDYDVPPPLPDELEYIERTTLVLDDPAFAFEAPQPSPVNFLEPPPREFRDLTPPAAPSGALVLPVPIFVPLPAYVRVPADVIAPTPLIFDNARETLVIRPAIDVPNGPNKQSASSAISIPSANNLTDGPRLPPSVAAKATRISNLSPPPLAVNPVATTVNPGTSEQIKTSLTPASRTASVTPQWFTDIKRLANPGIDPPTLATDSATSIPISSLAPPSTIVPFMLSVTGSVPLPNPGSVAPAQARTGLPPRTPPAAMLSPQTTGSIPPSVSRSITLAPPPTRSRSKPIATSAATSSAINPDQAKQPKIRPSPIGARQGFA